MDVSSIRAGLLAHGSSPLSCLPGPGTSGFVDRNSPFTVAGAAPVLALHLEHRTGFPLSLQAACDSEDPDPGKLASAWSQVNDFDRHAQGGNFSRRQTFGFSPAPCAGSPRRGMGDSPNPQMRLHAAPSGPVDMLQVSVFAAKKCRFHAPCGRDANSRDA